MRLRFSKMHSLGEDFVVIDGLTQQVRLSVDALRLLTDRRQGVGCQRVLVVEAPSQPDMDFRCRLLNKDGSLSSDHYQAAASCLALFAWERQLTARPELQIEGHHGARFSVKTQSAGSVTVGWDLPDVNATTQILTVGRENHEVSTLMLEQGHAILTVPSVGDAPVKSLGRRIQQHPRVASGINVGFMAVLSRDEIELRVLQRSGSEAAASASDALAAVITGRLKGLLNDQVAARTTSTRLNVFWQGEGKPVQITAPATLVYQGQIHL